MGVPHLNNANYQGQMEIVSGQTMAPGEEPPAVFGRKFGTNPQPQKPNTFAYLAVNFDCIFAH